MPSAPLRAVLGALLIMPLAGCASAKDLPLDRIKLPKGFAIELFADKVPGARSMTLGEKGTLFVGTFRHGDGKVYAIEHDGKRATTINTIAQGLNQPNGVAFRDGALYVAEISRILRFDGIESTLKAPPKPAVVFDKLPTDGHHGWKFIAFGPDGWLYVPVGAPCNICERESPYATIQRIKPDGSAIETFAKGVRNSVGFDWHPKTKELYFTDNGRDMLGDEVPPCELNHAPRQGMHFGYPYCHGTSVSDPEFGNKGKCADYTSPVVNFSAHTAPLGMRFYTGTMFPSTYQDSAFVAQHGSWNRSKRIGYQVMHVTLPPAGTKGEAVSTVFAEGWLDKAADKAWGRPVDVLVMPDGALLVSDDMAGVIYRISYRS